MELDHARLPPKSFWPIIEYPGLNIHAEGKVFFVYSIPLPLWERIKVRG
jgi:hypothetical protein